MDKEYNELLKKQIQGQITSNDKTMKNTSIEYAVQLAIANSNLYIALSNIAIANSSSSKK